MQVVDVYKTIDLYQEVNVYQEVRRCLLRVDVYDCLKGADLPRGRHRGRLLSQPEEVLRQELGVQLKPLK